MDDQNYAEVAGGLLILYKSGAADMEQNTTTLTHYHNACEFVLFERCALRIFAQNNWYDIGDGELVFIPKYTLHRIDYGDTHNYSRLIINFDPVALLEHARHFGCAAALERLDLSHCHVYRPEPDLFRRLLDAGRAAAERFPAAAPEDAALTAMRVILLLNDSEQLFSSYAAPAVTAECRFVKQAIDYIDAHYSREIRLDDLACALHVDKYYLCHIFKRQMRVTITKYIQSRRIIEAQKQLLHSDKPLDVIAGECGFNSLQYFHKIFRQISGHTPLAFRYAPCSQRTP